MIRRHTAKEMVTKDQELIESIYDKYRDAESMEYDEFV